MSVATYEQREIDIPKELYGASLRPMRLVGRMAIEGVQGKEYDDAVEQLKAEYYSTIFEGLSSDDEYGEGLRVVKFNRLPVIDEQVMSGNGQESILELIDNGIEASRIAAKKDKRMVTQLNRDKNDRPIAVAVQDMANGKTDYNTLFAISSDPSEAMERDGVKYWRGVGYIEDLIYVQMYHSDGGHTVLTGSLSFKANDKAQLRKDLAAFGIHIPAEESVDNYINYTKTVTMDAEEAMALSVEMKDACEQQNGDGLNTADVLKRNKPIVDKIFYDAYLPTSFDLAAHTKSDTIERLAASYLEDGDHFADKVIDGLHRIRNRDYFGDNDARLMSQLVAYSAIELLRKSLHNKNKPDSRQFIVSRHIDWTHEMSHFDNTQNLFNMIAHNAAIGAEANRSYSSCGAALEIAEKLTGLGTNQQEAFAGKADTSALSDNFGPLTFKCPKGHTNTRPRNQLIECCKTCGVSVKC